MLGLSSMVNKTEPDFERFKSLVIVLVKPPFYMDRFTTSADMVIIKSNASKYASVYIYTSIEAGHL